MDGSKIMTEPVTMIRIERRNRSAFSIARTGEERRLISQRRIRKNID
jgi:hypothetical protein